MWPHIPSIRTRETRLPLVDRQEVIKQLVESMKAVSDLVYQAGVAEGHAKGLEEGKKDGKGDD